MPTPQTTHEHAFTDDRPFTSCHASTLLELNGGVAVSYTWKRQRIAYWRGDVPSVAD